MWLSWDNQALGKSDAPGSAVPCCALEEWLTPKSTHPFHPSTKTTVLSPHHTVLHCTSDNHPQKPISRGMQGKSQPHLHLLGQQNTPSQTPSLKQSSVEWEADMALLVSKMTQISTLLGGPTCPSDISSLQAGPDRPALPWRGRWEWRPLPSWSFALWSFHV